MVGSNIMERLPAAVSPSHAGVAYRADIDGLRALSVALVLCFHARFSAFGGGFIGVDIFFVISGYLISRVVETDIEREKPWLREFYRRRIKRLLPAYALVTVATLIVAILTMLPGDLTLTAKAALTSAVYLSNMWLIRRPGYFEADSEINPLLHSWSLSVEEQFYLLFPVVMVILYRLVPRPRWRLGLFVAAWLASFALAQYMLARHPTYAFYLLPTRAWEVLTGVILGLSKVAGLRQRNALTGAIVAAALLVIIASAMFLRANDAIPGWAALPACMAAAALLWAGGQGDPVSRVLLENPVAVFFGNISYSLYLWHWPILTFYRYWLAAEPDQLVVLGLLLACVGAAWLSWRFVELPLRRRSALPGWRAFWLATVLSGGIVGTGLLLVVTHGLPGRVPLAAVEAGTIRQIGQAGSPCQWMVGGESVPEMNCTLGVPGVPPHIVIWGDSHARMLADELAEQAAERGQAIRLHARFACDPVPRVPGSPATALPCDDFANRSRKTILADPRIRSVVLIARWAASLKGWNEPSERRVRGRRFWRSSPTGAEMDLYRAELEGVVASLKRSGRRVVLLLPTPEFGRDLPRAAALTIWRGGDPAVLALSRRDYEARTREIRQLFATLSARYGAVVVDPYPFLCTPEGCPLTHNGKLIYTDDDHLNSQGAALLAPALYAAALPNPSR